MTIPTEIALQARFDRIRYAQCWEDAEVLLEALQVGPGDTCLSIASAGDNTLALAGAGACRVIALDLNPAQIACLELRIAACRRLEYPEFLQLLGQSACKDRDALYRICRGSMTAPAREFWDSNPELIAAGIAQGGRFERFLTAFRRYLLPLVQSKSNVQALLQLETEAERRHFYDTRWNHRRWRLLCRLFFSRHSLGRFGRDPGFTRFADEPVWHSLQRRIPQALVVQQPADNPYLQWILQGRFESALPWAWREENFARIRDNLDAIEWHCESLEQVLAEMPDGSLDGCNLSDVFEYMSPASYEKLLRELARTGAPGCRLVYWNVVVARSRPEVLAGLLQPLRDLSASLHLRDKAFFYRNLVVEEVC